MRLLPALASVILASSIAATASAQGATPKTPAVPAPVAKKKPKDDKPQGPIITVLGFEAIPGGGSRIYVELNSTVTITQHEAQGQVVYVLENAQIRTSNTENSLELYYHNTPALRAKLHRAPKDKKDKKKDRDAELLIQLKSNVKPTHRLIEGRAGSFRMEIDFPAGNFAPGAGADDQPPPPAPPPVKKDSAKDKKASEAAKPSAPAAKK
jgi:hypothetical protein